MDGSGNESPPGTRRRRVVVALASATVMAALAIVAAAAWASGGGGGAASSAATAAVGKAGAAASAPAREQALRRGPRGLRGPRGFRGRQGPAGPPGPSGPPGAAGSARAYALVNANSGNTPFIVAAASKNIVGVRRSGPATTGFYCLTLAGGVPDVGVAPVVSPEWSLSTGADLLAYPIIGPRGGTPSCQAGEIGVSTEDFGDTTRNDEVSFTIMIP